MTLENKLQGHLGDVNCIKWYDLKNLWITGGEDATIRICSYSGDCIQVINTGGEINCLTFDHKENILYSACNDIIKAYDLTNYLLVQTNIGHHDSIRDVCFIPERNHLVSVSWDKTIKIWRSYQRYQVNERKIQKKEIEKKFETWVWDNMKIAMKKEVSFDMNVYAEQLGLNEEDSNDKLS
jgi:WD40 repeat protein